MPSSSDIAIRVTGLSKKFRKGEIAHPRSIREAIGRLIPWGGHKLPKAERHDDRDFWALKDVSFELQRGEVLGIIGRNGAGKSTLLKVLSQIVAPTEGRVEVHGRLGALLEVGTGFHPELTGRENVFLNGALLGMTKAEIKREFDSIVEFSGVSEFIDTPVKHYSSGMYMRLAFAVAAHLRNEVLIVDEVLAVGDAEFQKKCLGKMQDVSKSGRTVLFVSHNSEAVARLCTQVLSLKGGHVVESGSDVQEIIARYLSRTERSIGAVWRPAVPISDPVFEPLLMSVVGSDGKPLTRGIARGEEAWIVIEGDVKECDDRLVLGYRLVSEKEIGLWASLTADQEREHGPMLSRGRVVVRSRIPTELLNVGVYRLEMRAGIHGERWIVPMEDGPAVKLEVALLAWPSHMVSQPRPTPLAPVMRWSASHE